MLIVMSWSIRWYGNDSISRRERSRSPFSSLRNENICLFVGAEFISGSLYNFLLLWRGKLARYLQSAMTLIIARSIQQPDRYFRTVFGMLPLLFCWLVRYGTVWCRSTVLVCGTVRYGMGIIVSASPKLPPLSHFRTIRCSCSKMCLVSNNIPLVSYVK